MAEQRKGETPEPQLRRAKKNGSRLHEIVEILRRNDIIHGLTPQKLRVMLEELGRSCPCVRTCCPSATATS